MGREQSHREEQIHRRLDADRRIPAYRHAAARRSLSAGIRQPEDCEPVRQRPGPGAVRSACPRVRPCGGSPGGPACRGGGILCARRCPGGSGGSCGCSRTGGSGSGTFSLRSACVRRFGRCPWRVKPSEKKTPRGSAGRSSGPVCSRGTFLRPDRERETCFVFDAESESPRDEKFFKEEQHVAIDFSEGIG